MPDLTDSIALVQTIMRTDTVSLFNHLSNAALTHILQFFSERPFHASWHQTLKNATKIEVAREGHPLKEAAKTAVKFLHLTWIQGDFSSDTMPMVLNTYGASCASLFLHVIQSPNVVEVPAVNECKRLKKLTLWGVPQGFPLHSVLSGQSNLEELELHPGAWDASIGEAITALGVGLKRLELSTTLSHDAHLTRMFARVGRTLRSLELTFDADGPDQLVSKFDVSKIATFCPLITDLSLHDKNVDRANFRAREIALYCNYGAQLERVALFEGDFTKLFLEKMVSYCPNVRIDISFLSNDLDLIIETLGPLICECFLMPDAITASALKAVAPSLSGVEVLYMDISLVDTLFTNPKRRLHRLHIDANRDEPLAPCDDAVLAIALNTGALREVKWDGPRIHIKTLQVLAEANRHLENVYVSDIPPDGEDVVSFGSAYIIDMIEAFEACQALCVLDLNIFFPLDMEWPVARIVAVEDACVRFRFRSVSIQLAHVEYNALCRK